MQEMPPLVKIKKVKVASHAPAPDSANDPKWAIVKTENEESILPNDPDFTPESLKPKPRGRKGRPAKTTVVSCCIPIQPEAPEAPEPEEPSACDDDMVQKITHLLIKHKYQNNQGPREIAELVSRVRRLVYSGNMDQLDSTDELTMSIARVLLGKDGQITMPPPLTDIACARSSDAGEPSATPVKQECEDTPSPAAKARGRPRKKQISKDKIKKGYVYEEVPSTSSQSQSEPDSEGRTRRRAALAAEKNFESPPVGDPVIDLEEDDSRDNEFVPGIPAEYEGPTAADEETDSADELVFSNIEIKTESNVAETSTKPPKNNLKKKDSSNIDAKQKKKKATVNNDLQTTNMNEQSSILLSDDDDYVPPAYVTRKKPGPARKTMKPDKVEPPAASSKSSEVVPLHPSLLSNKNFIKIVAHTYLSGNPMLDEDAATLAAQYSTFKALKEFEANGKNIDSGPIYDIAIKVSFAMFHLLIHIFVKYVIY